MNCSRRLTDQERRQIVRERAKGVSVSAISRGLKVSPKTVYNVLSRGRSAVSANVSRTRVLTMRVTDRDLRGFDAALARRGIAHRASCTALRAPRVAFRASRALVDAECSTSFGKSIAQPGSRRLSPAPRCLVAAKRTTANASCPPHHASRLPLDADAPRG